MALMVLATLCFTANVLLIRELGRFLDVSVWLLTSVRFLVGLAFLGVCYRRDFQPAHLFRNRKLVERGAVGAVGVYVAYVAYVHLGAGRTTFINSTYIFWAALLAAWIFHERLRTITIAGSIAALIGVALLTDVFAHGSRFNVYDLFAVLSALTSAIVAITIRQLHATEHTSTIFGAQCVYGLLLCGPCAMLHLQSLSAGAWGLLLLASACASAGQLAMTRAFRELTVADGCLMQMLSPIATTLGGALFFSEQLTVRELTGAVLILTGTASAAFRRQDL
jgi:drug/metabolite transporter (DMT)-like permease